MRIIVTGSRDYANREHLFACLDLHLAVACHDRGEPLRVVHGGARGADSLAQEWYESRKAANYILLHEPEVHRADWDTFGKKAGILRNIKMAALGADRCVAFLQLGAANKGTRHMIKVATGHGIPVQIHGEL